jgi:phospholipid/cholesterol/gamma-HCH transport system substrate-binding protein
MNIKSIISFVVVISLIIGGYFWMRSKREGNKYIAYYDNVQGLQQASPVQIKGVRVGKIGDIDLTGERVKVTITLKPDVALPEGTVAFLAAGGLTGDKVIRLDLGNSTNILPNESVIASAYDTSVMEMNVRISPMLETAKSILRNGDSTLQAVASILDKGFATKTTYSLIKIDESIQELSKSAAKANTNGAKFCNQITNWDTTTRNIAANRQDLNQSIKNAVSKTGELSKSSASMAQNIASIQKNMASLGNTFTKLNNSRSVNGKSSYERMTLKADTMNRSMQATIDDPPGIVLFGGKKKK